MAVPRSDAAGDVTASAALGVRGNTEPMTLQLLSGNDGDDTHLAITSALPCQPESLGDRIRDTLQQADEPMTRTAIRAALRVNNQRLGQALQELEDAGSALRTQQGWSAPDQQSLPLG
jgi:hypothetical protein